MQFNLDRTTRLHLLLIVAATFLAFGVSMTGYFIADDTWQLQFAYRVLHHGEWSLVAGNFVRGYLSLPSMDFYRPLLGLSYLLDYAIYGTFAAGFYLTNILMAALAGILLYFTAKALVPDIDPDRSNALALTSALLFVVSPLHCEDICWISGRADLLAAPFFLGALLAAIFARDWTTGKGKIHWRYYAISLVTYAFSLMSKESAITLPLVVAALFVLSPAASPHITSFLKGTGRDQDDGESVSDGKDQHIKKRKKVRGGRIKIQAELDARQKKEIDGDGQEQDSAQNDAADIDLTQRVVAAVAPDKAKNVTEAKTDWFSWTKQFVLFLTPYGALTIIYLFVRRHALGSFIGGYTGDMGEALSKWLLFRWFDPFNLIRMAFPVAKDNFVIFGITPDRTPTMAILGTIYAIILGVVVLRLVTQKLDFKLPFFLGLWLLASTVPLITMWGLDSNLHNQRVLYLFSAPMVMMLPSLIFLPKLGDRPSMQKQFIVLTSEIEDFLCEICEWCFYALTICLILISALVSFNWVMAGHQIKAIQDKTTALINDLQKGPDKKILVVRVPKDYLGAHVLMGGVNMIELLEPPFTKEHISQYMISFQRALVGPAEPVSSVKLKQEIDSLHDRKAYFWQLDKSDYKVVKYDTVSPTKPESLNLPIAASAAQANQPGIWYPDPPQKAEYKTVGGVPAIAMHNLNDEGGDGIVITGLDINPLAFDYVNFTLSMPHAPAASGVYLTFDDQEDAKAKFAIKPQICRMLQLRDVPPGGVLKETPLHIKVSHFGDWYSYSKIRRFKMTFSNVSAVSVSNISIWDDRRAAPQLRIMNIKAKPSGEYFCTAEPVRFEASAGSVAGAKSCQVDISKVNQSWDTFVSTDVHGRDTVLNHSYKVPLVGGKAVFQLDPRVYAKNGFYDVRVAMVDDKNQFLSDWSDLITLYRPDPTGAKAPFCADY